MIYVCVLILAHTHSPLSFLHMNVVGHVSHRRPCPTSAGSPTSKCPAPHRRRETNLRPFSYTSIGPRDSFSPRRSSVMSHLRLQQKTSLTRFQALFPTQDESEVRCDVREARGEALCFLRLAVQLWTPARLPPECACGGSSGDGIRKLRRREKAVVGGGGGRAS